VTKITDEMLEAGAFALYCMDLPRPRKSARQMWAKEEIYQKAYREAANEVLQGSVEAEERWRARPLKSTRSKRYACLATPPVTAYFGAFHWWTYATIVEALDDLIEDGVVIRLRYDTQLFYRLRSPPIATLASLSRMRPASLKTGCDQEIGIFPEHLTGRAAAGLGGHGV